MGFNSKPKETIRKVNFLRYIAQGRTPEDIIIVMQISKIHVHVLIIKQRFCAA